MKSSPSSIFCLLLWWFFGSSAEAQSMASNFLEETFKPSSNLQRQLETQQLAHNRDKDIICMVTLYPERDNDLLTSGFSVTTQKEFTEFEQGPIRGHKSGPYPLPDERAAKLKTLLAQLPAPSQPNPEKRRMIVSFLDGDKWITRIYDGREYRDTLQAIILITTDLPGLGSYLTGYKLPPQT